MDPDRDIITITLNPAIDQTVFLDQLRPGCVNRCSRHHLQPGGKGVNVSSLLGQFGIPTTATGFLGDQNPRLFEERFLHLDIRDAFIRIPGETRTGIKIIDQSLDQTTDINFPGLSPGPRHLQALEETLLTLARPGRWFVLAGSAPAGLDADVFGRIVRLLKSAGALVAADTSGEPLAAVIHNGADLIKPNHDELAQLVGCDPADTDACIQAACELQRSRVPSLILSLGAQGAVFLSPDAALRATPSPTAVVSTVGAGDALLAGYLAGLSRSLPPAERARLACAFARAAISRVDRILPPAAELIRQASNIEILPLHSGGASR